MGGDRLDSRRRDGFVVGVQADLGRGQFNRVELEQPLDLDTVILLRRLGVVVVGGGVRVLLYRDAPGPVVGAATVGVEDGDGAVVGLLVQPDVQDVGDRSGEAGVVVSVDMRPRGRCVADCREVGAVGLAGGFTGFLAGVGAGIAKDVEGFGGGFVGDQDVDRGRLRFGDPPGLFCIDVLCRPPVFAFSAVFAVGGRGPTEEQEVCSGEVCPGAPRHVGDVVDETDRRDSVGAEDVEALVVTVDEPVVDVGQFDTVRADASQDPLQLGAVLRHIVDPEVADLDDGDRAPVECLCRGVLEGGELAVEVADEGNEVRIRCGGDHVSGSRGCGQCGSGT